MKPLLIGEAPGPNGDPEKPLEGKPLLRLARCMGYDSNSFPERVETEMRERFEVRNLIDRPMQRIEGSRGTEWLEAEAEVEATKILHLVDREQKVVALGKRVAEAFGLEKIDWWAWYDREYGMPTAGLVVVPHPSGIVRLWNDPLTTVRTGVSLWQASGTRMDTV